MSNNDKLDPQVRFMAEVYTERRHQDAQWGGPEHDDQHGCSDWLSYIAYQAERSVGMHGEHNPRLRNVYVKMAALAMAAAESLERKTNNG